MKKLLSRETEKKQKAHTGHVGRGHHGVSGLGRWTEAVTTSRRHGRKSASSVKTVIPTKEDLASYHNYMKHGKKTAKSYSYEEFAKEMGYKI